MQFCLYLSRIFSFLLLTPRDLVWVPFAFYNQTPLYYPTAIRRGQKRQKRVKISRNICTPEDRLDRFSCNAQATNLIEVTKNMADNLNYFSDEEESELLGNIDPSLLHKSNED